MDGNPGLDRSDQASAAAQPAPECYWIPPGAIEAHDVAYHRCECFVQQLGYAYSVTPRRRLQLVSTNYPLQWRQRCKACKYIVIDPVARGVVTWARPFTWRSVRALSDESTQAFWNEAGQYGLQEGLVVPIRRAAGGRVSPVIAGAAMLDDPAIVRQQLGMAMGFVSELSEQLYERVLVERWRKHPGARSVLTPHQVEILRLLARGMTIKGVARQLNISSRSVQHAMERVLTRLVASNTLEAKFSAWTLGLIAPSFEIIHRRHRWGQPAGCDRIRPHPDSGRDAGTKTQGRFTN